jgi:hypothetical protein
VAEREREARERLQPSYVRALMPTPTWPPWCELARAAAGSPGGCARACHHRTELHARAWRHRCAKIGACRRATAAAAAKARARAQVPPPPREVGVHARAGGAAHASREFNECQLEEKGEDEVAISIYTAKQTQSLFGLARLILVK